MSDFKVTVDVSPLSDFLDHLVKNIEKDFNKSLGALAQGAYGHIKEKAQEGLHSFRKQYLESLSPPELVDGHIWVITLDDKAEWLEAGRTEPYDMKPGLLKNGKVSKDGTRYRIVPMNQAKAPTEMSPNTAGYEQNMVNRVKAELKKQGIPYKKLEIDPHTGSPRLGKLHELDINSSVPGKGNTPQLHGLNIYQTKQKDGSVKRTLTTFRTVTDKESQKDKWIHPAVTAKDLFGEARKWAEQEFESKILPELMEKYK